MAGQAPIGVRVPVGPFEQAPEHLAVLLAEHLTEHEMRDAVLRQQARVQWLADNLEKADVALGQWDRRLVELVAALGPAASQSFIGLIMRSWPGAELRIRPPGGIP